MHKQAHNATQTNKKLGGGGGGGGEGSTVGMGEIYFQMIEY